MENAKVYHEAMKNYESLLLTDCEYTPVSKDGS
jgi:hypothetical protein